MKFLFLTQYYPPETGAPQNRLHSLAVNIMNMGYSVEVLTAMPNYPKMEIFSKYQGLNIIEEKLDGIRVIRTSIYVGKEMGVIKRLINYFSFVWTSMMSLKKLSKTDYILCESPPLFLGISALYLAYRLNAKIIFNVSDLWPESVEKLNIIKNKMFLNIAYKLEAYLYKKSHLVTCQTQGIRNSINKRFNNVKTMWLPNGIDKDVYNIEFKINNWLKKYSLEYKRIYIYAGIIGHAQGLEVIIKAKEWLKKNEHEIASKIQFVIIGDGPEKNKLKALDKELKSEITFIPNIPKNEVIQMIKKASGYIIPLKKIPLFLGAIPSKIFDPLALGIPILLGVDGEARKLFIDEAKAGLYYEPENYISLAKSIIKLEEDQTLAKNLGEQGKIYVENKFDRNNIANNFINCLKSLKK